MRQKTTTLAAAVALAAFGASGAMAADLGGNCCSDLEERVAELEATTARKGNRPVSLEVSGHVNEAVMFWSGPEGFDNRPSWSVVPNTNSQSRVRFKGSTRLTSDFSAGFLLEFGVGSFDSDLDSDLPGRTQRSVGVRHSAAYLKSKSAGTIWLGRTSSATDGIAEICLCGGASNVFTQMSVSPTFDSLGIPSILTSNVLRYDGQRDDVVRYISPSIGGFVLSVSASNDSNADLAGNVDPSFQASLRYAGEFGGIRVAAGVGFSRDDRIDDEIPVVLRSETISGSASVMHTPSGLFISGAYGEMDGRDDNPLEGVKSAMWWIKGGAELGNKGYKTTVYAEYGTLHKLTIDGDSLGAKLDVYGLGVNKQLGGAVDVYLGWRRHEVGIDGDNEDFDVVKGGIKIQF